MNGSVYATLCSGLLKFHCFKNRIEFIVRF